MSLTEQICTNNTLGCVGHKDGKCHSIENCKYKVEQPVTTIGDKIRESNESLAEFIMEIQEDVKNGETWWHIADCINYLNQPYTDSKIN